MNSMNFRDPVEDGLAAWFCNHCQTIPCHTFPSAQVQCPRGHKCSKVPSQKSLEKLAS